ncbi:TetR/AcrR family transcriptional regulator [Streptomyces sp. CA2R106]|uniref:TetR/AcrR family transcriptional regulator n=1 Tax=Streptomyces sp. CA2R106 TaxID=3120153 RepID=UPI00300BDB9E
MSPKHRSTVSDCQSETETTKASTTAARRPGRPAFPRELVLEAAAALFADTDAPRSVSMDDIAAAAGVGKGTLFRAFGSRDGLLDALFAAHAAPLRAALEQPDPPLGSAAPPLTRVLALFDELVTFKLTHRHLTAARELSGAGLLRAPHYVWTHDVLRALIARTDSPAAASPAYTAHVLLGAVRADLVDELLASGRTPDDIRHDVAALVRTVLAAPPH